MYRLWGYEAMGNWQLTLTYVPTAEERLGGALPTVERATIPAKPGRDRDLDFLSAASWALDRWSQWCAERTP